jgi:hypothetical protein
MGALEAWSVVAVVPDVVEVGDAQLLLCVEEVPAGLPVGEEERKVQWMVRLLMLSRLWLPFRYTLTSRRVSVAPSLSGIAA